MRWPSPRPPPSMPARESLRAALLMDERDDIVEVAFGRYGLGHHGHLPAGNVLLVGAAHGIAEMRELPLQVGGVEAHEPRRVERRNTFGAHAMAGAALALVEIVAVVQVAGGGSRRDGLRLRGDPGGDLRDR